MREASTQQPSVCPSEVKHLNISKHWNDTHWGAPMFSLVVFMAWWGLGFGWLSPFDIVWTAPTGLYLSGEFGASWGWGKAGFMWAERTGETPLTFATWARGTVPFWVAPKHKWFTKCITGKQHLNLNFDSKPLTGRHSPLNRTSTAFCTVPWRIKALELCSRVRPYSWNKTQNFTFSEKLASQLWQYNPVTHH